MEAFLAKETGVINKKPVRASVFACFAWFYGILVKVEAFVTVSCTSQKRNPQAIDSETFKQHGFNA